MATKLLLSLILLLSLLSLSSPLPTKTVLDAAEVLSNSGFISMALTLELVSKTLIPESPSLTIFSPSDAAFVQSGQPPIPVLQLHFSPLSFTLQALKSLPAGSKIPTLLANHSLAITSSPFDNQISLNGVMVNGSPIYDDGSLIIFGIEEFFNPNFLVSRKIPSHPTNVGCVALENNSKGGRYFDEAIGVLRSRRYSIMASFLDLQLAGIKEKTALTLFAPFDDVMFDYVGNFSDLSSILFRHVVPCRISWGDLVNFSDETVLPTNLEGFKINFRRSGDIMMLNEVPIIFPDMYFSDSLVVHGLHEVLVVPERTQEVARSLSEIGSSNVEIDMNDGEF